MTSTYFEKKFYFGDDASRVRLLLDRRDARLDAPNAPRDRRRLRFAVLDLLCVQS